MQKNALHSMGITDPYPVRNPELYGVIWVIYGGVLVAWVTPETIWQYPYGNTSRTAC
jgi:hypothetical protein